MKFFLSPGGRMAAGLFVFVMGVALLYRVLKPGLSPAHFFSIAIIILIIVVAVWARTVKKMAGQFLLDKGLKALNRECDPVTAIQEHSKKLEIARLRGEKNAEMLFLNNLAVAYHANGETGRALSLLQNANVNRNNPAMQMVHHGNMAVLYWDSGDYEAFWREKEIVDNYIRSIGHKNEAYHNISRQMERIAARADILNGHYQKALDYFSGQMQNIPPYDIYAKVSNTFIIAGIYYLMGDMDNYRKCLEFVAENGNLLYVAKLACERLLTGSFAQ